MMSKRASVDDCRLIRLPKHERENGNITVVENDIDLPFAVKRVYYLYDVPGGERRGGHAYIRNRELMVALSGSFEVLVDDGLGNIRTFRLSRSYYGLYVPAGLWREMRDFSTNAVAMILASEPYDRSDYIENFRQFRQYAREQAGKRP